MAFVDAVFGEKQGVIFLDVACLTYTVLKEGWFTIQDDIPKYFDVTINRTITFRKKGQ
tara:strand:+ start:243 stop:416 length:174 start_codon:yes stop_codon:yes gene_type:complete